MIACEVWLRRDYLLRKNITPKEPPCACADCPAETPSDVTEAEQRRYPGDH